MINRYAHHNTLLFSRQLQKHNIKQTTHETCHSRGQQSHRLCPLIVQRQIRPRRQIVKAAHAPRQPFQD